MVVLRPVPAMFPGLIVQFPAGSPFNSATPPATVHVGCVTVPIVGVAGVPGFEIITALADAKEVHPTELVTVYEYVPAVKPDIVLFSPVPAIAPGLIVQFPAGKPDSSMLPVATVQLGCIIKFIAGADGVTGCAFMTAFAVGNDVHPTAFVTVKLYVPETNPVMVLLAPVPAIAPGLIVQFPAGKPFKTTLPVATAQVG